MCACQTGQWSMGHANNRIGGSSPSICSDSSPVSYFETILFSVVIFMYFIYVICLGRLFIGDWRRRHVGSKSYKEGSCKEKEKG
jgi:hypothetical protein